MYFVVSDSVRHPTWEQGGDPPVASRWTGTPLVHDLSRVKRLIPNVLLRIAHAETPYNLYHISHDPMGKVRAAISNHWKQTTYRRSERTLASERWLFVGLPLVPFNRWALIPSAFLIQMCVGSLYAWSGFNAPSTYRRVVVIGGPSPV